MSSSSNSSALTKRSASNALMAPPPAPKRIKRPTIVLDEDTYTNAVAHIIRRDFFPGLAETDAQREYLNAVESGNKDWIREAGKTLTQVMTPGPKARARAQRSGRGQTPAGRAGETPKGWVGDTPVTVAGTEAPDSDEEDKPKNPPVDLNLSLSAFQAKYISEDQESFSQILDRQNAKRFEKTAWMRSGNLLPSKQRLAQQKVLEASKTSESTSQALTLRPSQNLDDRPAAPTTHKHVPFNALMYAPDSIEDWAPTVSQLAESSSLAPPKAVVHHNTRLPDPPISNGSVHRPSSPTLSAVRDAVAGHPRLTASDIGYEGSETPRVNGYAFVDAVGPEQRKAQGADEDSEDDAPTDLLERYGAKANPSPFTISEAQRREKLHHKMVDRISHRQSSSNSGSHSGGNPGSRGFGDALRLTQQTPRFLSAPTPKVLAGMGITPGGGAGGAATPGGGKKMKNVGNLTPAAQRLYQRVGGGTPRSGNLAGGFGGGGGSSGGGAGGKGREWTPTPKVRRRA